MNQSDIWRVTPVEVPIEVTFLVLMCVVGTFGNILTFTATFRSKKLRTPLHLILSVAMVADMVICGINAPFVIYGTILGRWDLHEKLCQFIGVLLQIAAGVSLVLNVVIALNRVSGCFPHIKICRKLSSPKATKVCITLAIFYTIGLLSPIIFGYLKIDYLLPYGTCLISNDNPLDVLADYLTVIGALGAYSSIIIIALMYISIFIRLKVQSTSIAVKNKKKGYMKATRNMVILYIFYVICWTPDVLHNKIDVMLEAPVWVTRLCFYTIFLHSCLNPIIYFWRIPEYRRTVSLMFRIDSGQIGASTFRQGDPSEGASQERQSANQTTVWSTTNPQHTIHSHQSEAH